MNVVRGQAMIEALVAVAIAVVALVALLRASNRSVNNSGLSRRQAIATSYATEALHWLKGQKTTLGFNVFKSNLNCASYPCTKCMTNLDWTSLCPSTLISSTEYTRNVVFGTPDSNSITATVAVGWNENGVNMSAKQTYVFINK